MAEIGFQKVVQTEYKIVTETSQTLIKGLISKTIMLKIICTGESYVQSPQQCKHNFCL